MAAVLLLVFLMAGPALAENVEFHAKGKVLDKDQKPVGDADITLKNKDTGHTLTTRGTDNGEFEFPAIPAGNYAVTIKSKDYITFNSEWRLEESKATREVVLPPVVMLTQDQAGRLLIQQEMLAGAEQAAERMRNGDYDGALAILNPLLQKHPDAVDLHYLNGLCLYNKQSLDAATDSFLKAISLDASFAPAHFQLGLCYQRNKMTELALESYKIASQLDPKNASAAYNAATILYDQNKAAEAIPLLENALAVRPDDVDALEALGFCYIQLGDAPKAIESLQKASDLTRDPARRVALEADIRKLKEEK